MLARKSHAEKKKVIIWLDAVQDIHPYIWMRAYDALTNECGYIYPPREEVAWADFKIYDMQAFDRIAEVDRTFRSLVCYPEAQDRCLPPDKSRTVFKRSHSCGCEHVQMTKENAHGVPRCEDRPPIDYDDKLPKQGYYRWFHQDYVSSLVEFGEFRVFMATKGGANSPRQPYVVHTIRTKWFISGKKKLDSHKIGDRYRAVEVTPEMRWSEYPWMSYETLTQYALHVYRQLQASLRRNRLPVVECWRAATYWSLSGRQGLLHQ
jgi:hypothetical protein